MPPSASHPFGLRLALALGLVGAACTFPDVTIVIEGSSSSGGAGGTEQGGNGATNTGTWTFSTGGTAAMGGGASGADGGRGGACDTQEGCDMDCDTFLAEGTCGGDDCNDESADVFPGQTKWFEVGLPGSGFDYNCDDEEEPEFETVQCSGAVCAAAQNVFVTVNGAAVECGDSEDFGDCNALLCQAELDDNKVQRCR